MLKVLGQIALKNRSYQTISKLNLNSLSTSQKSILPNKDLVTNIRYFRRNQSTTQQAEGNIKTSPKPSPAQNKPNESNSFRKLMLVFASGAVAYFGISYYLENRQTSKPSGIIDYKSQNLPGRVKPTKSLNREKNPGNIKITLYQYVTCPFCCKVRAYLDYYGYSYDIVEVNSINKKQLDWSSYKKVPTLAIQIPSSENPDNYEEKIFQLNDSSVIISALETFRLDPSMPLEQINKFYEPAEIESGDKSKSVDILNKYFVMLHNDRMNDGKDVSERKDEREWRRWVDTKFVHVISPNVYRTFNEALDAFNWFDKVGDWQAHFSNFERSSIIYLGSIVMYFLGKSLTKKHNLKQDVRVSLYDLCDEWVKSLNGTFRGGAKPNLADLALYGSMGSFEGCQAFEDMMNNTKIRQWYESCKDHVENSKGSYFLHNQTKPAEPNAKPTQANNNEINVTKKKRFIFF